MGATLAKAVITDWSHLTDTEFRVLMAMALTALDTPSKGLEPRVYFGGRDPLGQVLRRPWPTCAACDTDPVRPAPCPEHRKKRDVIYRDVRAALARLVELKAIERIGEIARDGTRQRYRLLIAASPGASARPRHVTGKARPSRVHGPFPPGSGGHVPFWEA